VPVYRWGLGGPIGSGEQWMPWIHIDDAARVYHELIVGDEEVSRVNAVAPNPVRNKTFSRILADVLARPHLLRVPAWAIRMKYDGFADELTASQRAVPSALKRHAFSFRICDVETALRDILED